MMIERLPKRYQAASIKFGWRQLIQPQQPPIGLPSAILRFSHAAPTA
jgi:hypothetical protein